MRERYLAPVHVEALSVYKKAVQQSVLVHPHLVVHVDHPCSINLKAHERRGCKPNTTEVESAREHCVAALAGNDSAAYVHEPLIVHELAVVLSVHAALGELSESIEQYARRALTEAD